MEHESTGYPIEQGEEIFLYDGDAGRRLSEGCVVLKG
jgi:hypothetical protein